MNTEAAAKPTRRILVIDDNRIIQHTINFMLRPSGYQIMPASDISEGIQIIRKGGVNLILLDLSFPLDAASIGSLHQDGFFFIDWLGRTPGISKPPVIVISSTDPSQYSARAAEAGIKCCLQKPLNKESLLAAVQSVLNAADNPVKKDE